MQMRELGLALARAPGELGYASASWNSNMLHAEIGRRYGVSLSQRHCQRLLAGLRQQQNVCP